MTSGEDELYLKTLGLPVVLGSPWAEDDCIEVDPHKEQESLVSSTDLWLNDNCNKVCRVVGDTVVCDGIGNVFVQTIDGFPVETAPNQDELYVLYENVFNDVPGGWSDVRAYRDYEDDILTPWLKTMGFEDVRWFMGEADSFGPLSRIGRMTLNGRRFEYIYG